MNKVFFQNKSISFLTGNQIPHPDNNELILRFDGSNEPEFAFKLLKTSANINKIVLFGSDNIENCFEDFKNSFIIEKAAGGMVKNEKNELLLIYRNAHWDLPKGHIEKGENEEQAAIREVTEECSVDNIILGKKIDYTYHIFEKNGRDILKQTAWFEMKIKEYQQPIPQTEEGLEKAEWKTNNEVINLFDSTYPSIVELIKKAP